MKVGDTVRVRRGIYKGKTGRLAFVGTVKFGVVPTALVRFGPKDEQSRWYKLTSLEPLNQKRRNT